MKSMVIPFKTPGQVKVRHQRGAVFAALVLTASVAHADAVSDYFNSPFSISGDLAVNGSELVSAYEYMSGPSERRYTGIPFPFANQPHFVYAGVDLGVLKVAQSTPAWVGAFDVGFSTAVTAAYRDTLTFTKPGGGMVPVTFSFAFDGSVSTGVPYGAGPFIQMAVAGSAGGVSTSSSFINTYRDGVLTSNFNQACRNSSAYNAYVCSVSNAHRFATNGDKVGTTTFTFNVLSGESVNVWTSMGTGNTSDSSTPYASVVDFSHTATLTSIVTPLGTSVASQLGGILVESNGGLTYQQAITAAVPEPSTWALWLTGVALLLTAVRKQRSAAL
jgi:hypothetical protein